MTKNTKLIVLIVAVIAVVLGIRWFKSERVGGPCSYVNFEFEVVLTNYDATTQLIECQTADSSRQFRVAVKDLKLPFSEEHLLNFEDHMYVLKGEEITEGTCTPFIYKSLSLK